MQTEYIFTGHVPFVLVKLLFWMHRVSSPQSDEQSRMKVTEKDVAYVAGLANLELTGDERARMLRDLNSILEHIDTLNELDTTGASL